jgi:thioredoxin reductase (NADPH)
MSHNTDIAIIGAGPVGLFAIFECGMLKMNCHVIDALEEVGGQCTALYPEKPIYDIAGFPEIPAAELIERLHKQAEPFKPTYHMGQQVIALKKSPEGWELTTNKGTVISAKVVIIAAGCGAFGPNRPPISGIEEYEDTGAVAYMVQRREVYRGKTLVIAGGGDSAVDWAVSLSDIAKHIHVVHRRDKFRAAPEMVEKMMSLAKAGKITFEIPYQPHSINGAGGKISEVVLKDLEGKDKAIKANHLLAFFGLAMELGPIAQWGLGLEQARIRVNPATCATNLPGIFAIGDINTYEGKLKLIICGFSEAAMAAHASYAIVNPNKALHFEYSTSKGVGH